MIEYDNISQIGRKLAGVSLNSGPRRKSREPIGFRSDDVADSKPTQSSALLLLDLVSAT